MPQKLSQGWVQIIAAEGPVVVWVGNTEHLWDGKTQISSLRSCTGPLPWQLPACRSRLQSPHPKHCQ